MSTLHNEPNMIGFELTHSLLRAEIVRLARAYVHPIEQTDTEVVEDHLRVVTEHLVRHHLEEDEFHWPLLARRAPELVEFLDQLQSEHATLDPQLQVILDRTLPQLERGEALQRLARALTDHFDDEDRVVIPALRRHITADEQAGSMERSRRKIPAADELLVLSMMLDAATDEQRDRMLAVLPKEAIALWRTVGVPQLADIHHRLRPATEPQLITHDDRKPS